MGNSSDNKAWVSFCISTYKRPAFLKSALETISRQTFRDFEVVVSDNDPEGSAGPVVKGFNDPRFKYFCNGENLGMIQSFNKSIERSSSEYITMITDDDPVEEKFLEEMFALYNQYKDYSIYCGFSRTNTTAGAVEIIEKDDFITEILDVKKTTSILWSSAVMKKQAVNAIGKLPDYGSPHLSDHAMIAMTGSISGGIVINKMYSYVNIHDNNFSKFNFRYYTIGCRAFYEIMTSFCEKHIRFKEEKDVVIKHIGNWFIVSLFNLKRYYTVNKNKEMTDQVTACARQIIAYPFMRRYIPIYFAKGAVFYIKKKLRLLRYGYNAHT